MDSPVAKKLAAECFGAFCLVLAGTGAIDINDVSGGAVSHVGMALTFGLVVLARIYTVGDISGAHLNPAVTLRFFLARRFDAKLLLPDAAGQCAGAVGASMNPARSLGPAPVSLRPDVLWLYLTAPCRGAALASRVAGACGNGPAAGAPR